MNTPTFSCLADLAIALQEVASVVSASIKKKFRLGSKAKGPFINKLIHDNLLTEWYYLINYCGLYPKLTELCDTWSPDLVIAHQGFVKRDKNVRVEYEALIKNLLLHPHAKWSTYAKSFIFPRLLKCYTKFDSTDKPSINVLFLMMYAAQIAELIELDNIVATSMFRLGGLVNPKSENAQYKLNNILFKGDDDDEPTLMNDLTDLNFMDSAHKIMNVSTMGLGLFSITNSGQKDDDTYKAKWKTLGQWQTEHQETSLLSVNSNPEPLASPTAKKQSNNRGSRAKQAKLTNAKNNATNNDDTSETDMKTPSPANAKRKKTNEAKLNDVPTESSQFDVSRYATCFQELTNHMKDKRDPNIEVLENALLSFLNDKSNTTYDEYSKAIAVHTPVKEVVAESSTPTWDKKKLIVTLSMFGSQNGNKSMVMKNKNISNDTFRLLGRGGEVTTPLPGSDFMHYTSIYAASAWESYHGNPKVTSMQTQNLNKVIVNAENHGWVTSIRAVGSKRPEDGDLIFCTREAYRALTKDKDYLLDDFPPEAKAKDMLAERERNNNNNDDCQSETTGEDCPPTKKRASEGATATNDDNSERNDNDGQSTKRRKKEDATTDDSTKEKKTKKKSASPKKLTPPKKDSKSDSQGKVGPPSKHTRSASPRRSPGRHARGKSP